MFPSLPHTFKSHDLPADVRTLLLLRKSMACGLVHTLGDIYLVLKGIVVKDPTMIGPFTLAYYDYFLSVDFQQGESLEEAVARSKAFQEWKEMLLEAEKQAEPDDIRALVNQFLDEVHLTTYDIQDIIDGKDMLAQDNPDMADQPTEPGKDGARKLDKVADYRNIDLQELLRRMERVARQQRDRHTGGSHWIGTGGISPYGHGGAAAGGVRVGGQGGGSMARAVMGDPRYFPVDMDQQLSDNNVDAALAALKGIFEESATKSLDIPNTIKTGLKRGGLFLPEEKDIISEKMRIILMIDNGGFSMDFHIGKVTELFKKMKTRFAHDLEVFYYHNTVYNYLYTNERRTDRIAIDQLLAKDPDYAVFIVGDAAMAPYELSHTSIQHWHDLREKFKKIAWLNPDRIETWKYSYTVEVLAGIIPMYPLTPHGIEEAVIAMNKIKIIK
ncbi:hypothetical protein QQ020_18325 [Fulvivirgaceae bacterium BMA12]|uniref:VWA containing CoxE family protein n=1 Tax=Agaribacillus aureus TaxID=3051825 RepID=A0ABT8L8E7_9BACT|nr:hypothetical protein [Fulvivirgaceae bacterium BMA12]